jgi:chemotaxis protein MotB
MRPLIALEEDGDRNDATDINRWMVSYADFITLLFVLFLVLYARLPRFAEPPPPKPLQVQVTPEMRPLPALAPAQAPAPEPVAQVPQPAVAQAAAQHATAQAGLQPVAPDPQKMLLDNLAHSFADLVSAGNVSLVARKDGVVLEISDTSLFASGTAQPAPQAQEIIAKIAAAIGGGSNAVIVEGHTDNVPIRTAQYPSNWELSSARAASVVRALQERGISADRLTASGLAHTRPRSSNDTEQGRRDNRRVSFIVLNDAQ